MSLTFEQRLESCSNPLMRKLLQIIIDKKSTLCVAADIYPIETVIKLVHQIGPHICMLKLHMGIYQNERERLNDFYDQLCQLKKKHNFLLFEDRKYFDGNQAVQLDCAGYFRYFDLVTVVPLLGDATFRAIESAVQQAGLPEDEPRGCLAICELSFGGASADRQELGCVSLDGPKILDIAQRNHKICAGIIAQKLKVQDPSLLIKASPGVHMSQTTDGRNQQWRTPEAVVADGADVIIVGRGIVGQPEERWADLAREYKEKAFQSYLAAL